MPSFNYFSLGDDHARGNVSFEDDTFYALIVGSGYTPNQAHSKRSDITGEVTGTGYSTGGREIAVAAIERVNGVTSVTFAAVVWPSPVSGFEGVAVIIYKRRGGSASADELVSFVEFDDPITAGGGTYTFTPATPLTITIPVAA